jgi:hypothetical protein
MRTATVLTLAMIMVVSLLVQATPAMAAGKTHDVNGTVVSTDAAGKKITYKDESGTSITVPVLDKAVGTLKTLKPGEKIVMTCQDNENGDHEGISAIKVAKAAKASK